MAVNVVFYSGFAQDDKGFATPILDNQKQVGDPVPIAGGASAAVPEGSKYAAIQGDADFQIGVGAAAHAASHTYAAGGILRIRVRDGDEIFIT